jgi:hypothetical protein
MGGDIGVAGFGEIAGRRAANVAAIATGIEPPRDFTVGDEDDRLLWSVVLPTLAAAAGASTVAPVASASTASPSTVVVVIVVGLLEPPFGAGRVDRSGRWLATIAAT